MKWWRGALAIGTTAALGLGLSGCTRPWQPTLLSVNASGSDSGNGPVGDGLVFSPDGTKVAFTTAAYDLGATDTNGYGDAYVRDLTTGTTTLAAARPDGSAGNHTSYPVAFTADGTKLFYVSAASDLGWQDSNHGWDIFLRDLTTGTTELVTGNAAGTATANGSSTFGGASPDGTTVVFNTTANDLGPADTNAVNAEDVYVRNIVTGDTTLVSTNAAGTDGTGFAYNGRMSADGTKVAWEYLGTAAYVHDLTSGSTSLVSAAADGSGADGSVGLGSFSPDGTKVSFVSTASNLGARDTNGEFDVYVRDLEGGSTTLVSANAEGTDGGNAPSFEYGFSPDGSQVLFVTTASDLGPVDTNGKDDVYLRDLEAGSTTLVSVNADGTDSGNERSVLPTFSADGTRVAFQSTATDLGPADTVRCRRLGGIPPGQYYYEESCSDVYVRDLTRGETTLASTRADGRDAGNSDSERPVFGPAGYQLAFQSLASDLVAVDTNGLRDYYLATPR